jgi:TetR/AcrR family transcriptional regulator, transcriptional repressor of bet genes
LGVALRIVDIIETQFLVLRTYNETMTSKQSAFRRSEPEERRTDLIAACARALAKVGGHGASVRVICAEAGVSPGLLRHYFDGIDALIAETYRETGVRVAEALNHAVTAAGDAPRTRLIAFITASFRPPIADPDLLSTWLAFWGLIRTKPLIAAVHDEIYAENRRTLEALLRACPGAPKDVSLSAIALTALVDGLWLELSLGTAPFFPEEAEALAERWIDTLLG